MKKLQDKRILITGGAGDIGSVAAYYCLEEGARVMLSDYRQEALERVAGYLQSRDLYTCVADVTSVSGNRKMVAAAQEELGGLDGFFANAGIEGMIAPIAEYDPEIFDQVMAVNVRGPWLGIKAAMPVLAQAGDEDASIVITSSIAGLKGCAGISAYSISKHAVVGLMRSAALEGASHGVRVNTINPSPVCSRMMRSLESGFAPENPEEVRAAAQAKIPLGRYAEPEDVAKMLVFLLSKDAEFITGGIFSVDGGNFLT